MPLSSDPQARERQLGNLKRTAATTHGAKSETQIRPLRERYVAELRAEFPNASERRLIIQAHRLAQLELLGAFTDDRGVIRHKRRGDVFPAAALAEKVASAYLAEHERLEAAERAAALVDGTRSLEQVIAEIESGADDAR